jgi:GNAT superfamily N-acetyltransferase
VPDSLVDRLHETVHGYLALGNEVIEGPLVSFVRNVEAATIYDANFAAKVRARSPKDIDAVLARCEDVLGASGHRQFMIDPDTPPQVEARLALEGYERNDELDLVLDGELRAPASSDGITLRPVVSAEDWSSFGRLVRANHEEQNARGDRAHLSEEVTLQMVLTKQLKDPMVVTFLATVKREDCGYFSCWPGTNGLAKVEDLFTRPDHRHRGVGTALIHRCVDEARSRGAKEVSISAAVDDTPKDMYAAMGFRPVSVLRFWLRTTQE